MKPFESFRGPAGCFCRFYHHTSVESLACQRQRRVAVVNKARAPRLQATPQPQVLTSWPNHEPFGWILSGFFLFERFPTFQSWTVLNPITHSGGFGRFSMPHLLRAWFVSAMAALRSTKRACRACRLPSTPKAQMVDTPVSASLMLVRTGDLRGGGGGTNGGEGLNGHARS